MKIIFFIAMLVSVNVFSDEAKYSSDENGTITEYVQRENSGDYRAIYNLFSDSQKMALKRDFSISDSEGYYQLRIGLEAKWHNFVEVKRSFRGANVLVGFDAAVEENGESENVSVLLELVFENGQWKINSIDY